MKLTVRGKNLEVTGALRDYAEKRLDKLSRYFDEELDAQVLLSTNKDLKTVEVTVFVEGIVLRAVDKNPDMYAAIDLVVDKIVRQIHKYKTRLTRRFQKQNLAFHAEAVALENEVEEEVDLNVVKTKTFLARPMSVDEAILQMNLIGHDFFVLIAAHDFHTPRYSAVFLEKGLVALLHHIFEVCLIQSLRLVHVKDVAYPSLHAVQRMNLTVDGKVHFHRIRLRPTTPHEAIARRSEEAPCRCRWQCLQTRNHDEKQTT